MNELDKQYWINKSEYYHPYLYHLNKIKWSIFGTLTWKSANRRGQSPQAERNRRTDFNQFIRSFRAEFQIPRKKLLYYKATEYGAGESHFHFLIARNNLEHLSSAECASRLEDLWKSELTRFDATYPGIGLAEVKPYEEAHEYPAVEYCLKREWNGFDKEQERWDYLSLPLIKFIKRNNQLSIDDSFEIKSLIEMPRFAVV